VRRPADFEEAFRAALAERVEGLLIIASRVLLQQRRQIAEFVRNNRIAAAGGWGDWTKDGLLLTYGPNTADPLRRIATYIDKILKGANAGDLPIERPTQFELIINLKTANAFGLTLPASFLARADEVIH
jgi:putative ABC transport system substrate-binding protein